MRSSLRMLEKAYGISVLLETPMGGVEPLKTLCSGRPPTFSTEENITSIKKKFGKIMLMLKT